MSPFLHQKNLKKKPLLGIVRLDYEYPPAVGDIDHPESFEYRVVYRIVPGLTFEMCQTNDLTETVRTEFVNAVRWLAEIMKVDVISGDCGFMMYLQDLARESCRVPVAMSSLGLLPLILWANGAKGEIVVMTASDASLKPMRSLIREQCGVDASKFHIVGCQDVPGFEAVALGEKVDVVKVEPGIVALAKESMKQFPNACAFLMECTELPHYSDAVRIATGLPVYDAITLCNFFMHGVLDNIWSVDNSRIKRSYVKRGVTMEEKKVVPYDETMNGGDSLTLVEVKRRWGMMRIRRPIVPLR